MYQSGRAGELASLTIRVLGYEGMEGMWEFQKFYHSAHDVVHVKPSPSTVFPSSREGYRYMKVENVGYA